MTVGSAPSFRALLVGFYGAPNVGDEVLLDVAIHRVRELGGEPVVASIDPNLTSSMHGVEAVQFGNLGQVVSALAHCDLLIMGGGGIFQDHHPFQLEGAYLPYANDIAGYARPLLAANQLGIPCVIWGHGVGPLRRPDARMLVREVFQQAARVSVRDPDSHALLTQIGVNRPVVVAPDPGWLFSHYHPLPALADKPGESSSPVLAVVVREWAKGSWKEPLAAALKAVVPSGWRICWVSFQSPAEDSAVLSDLPLIDELRAMVGGLHQSEVVSPPTPEAAWELLAGCNAVFSMRLHASILAIQAGIPTCGLEYDEKLSQAHRMAGMPESMRLAIGDSSERFAQALLQAINGRWSPAQETMARLQGQAQMHLDMLADAAQLARPAAAFDAARMDWVTAWLEQSLRELDEVTQSSQRAHTLLEYRDYQIGQLQDELTQAQAVLEQLRIGHAEEMAAQAAVMESDAALRVAALNETLGQTHAAMNDLHALHQREVAAQVAAMNEILESKREAMERAEQQVGDLVQRLREAEIALADARDDLQKKGDYITDKEVYIAQLLQQTAELEAALKHSQQQTAEAQDLWRRLRLGLGIVRRDLLRAFAAPFKLVSVWRRYGLKIALQQIPRRMKTVGQVQLDHAGPAQVTVAPVSQVRHLRAERMLVLASTAADDGGWPTRAMQLCLGADRAGFLARLHTTSPQTQVDTWTADEGLKRLLLDAATWLAQVDGAATRVVVADASEPAVVLAEQAHARGAEIIVDFASLPDVQDNPLWPRLQAVASRSIHDGRTSAVAGLPTLLLAEAGDNEIFDSYRSHPRPAAYSNSRANVLVMDLGSEGDQWLDKALAARHDALFHVARLDGQPPQTQDRRIRPFAWTRSRIELAGLMAAADVVVLLGQNDRNSDELRRLCIAALLLERPVLVQASGINLESPNLHQIDDAALASQLALASVEDYRFVASNTWLGRAEVLMSPAYPSSVSVVVLIYNNRRIIERCVRTMLDHAGEWLHEIVVVDNNSVDGGAELVEQLFADEPKVKLVRNAENGCSSGRNLGVKHSSGKYIAFFDSDQWLTSPTCFAEAVSILELGEGVGTIGWNAGWFDATRDDLGGPISDYLPNRGMNAEAQMRGYRADVGFLGTSCMFITRELFESMQGFDTFYDPTCFEDTDICFQVKKAGYSVAFRDLAGVRHQPHQTTGASEGSERYRKLFARNADYFREKWKGSPEFFVDLKSWH